MLAAIGKGDLTWFGGRPDGLEWPMERPCGTGGRADTCAQRCRRVEYPLPRDVSDDILMVAHGNFTSCNCQAIPDVGRPIARWGTGTRTSTSSGATPQMEPVDWLKRKIVSRVAAAKEKPSPTAAGT